MSLESELTQWDGRATDVIQTIYERHSRGVSFVQRLITALQSPGQEAAAARLLRMYCERGKSMPLPQIRDLLTGWRHLTNWTARLELLQTLPHLRIPGDCITETRAFLDDCLSDQTVIVQGWAYSAYRALAVQHPDLRPEVKALYDDALTANLPGLVAERVQNAVRAGFER